MIKKSIISSCVLVSLFFLFKSFYEKNSLREISSKSNFNVGASVLASPFLEDEQYKNILKRDFNLITIENDLKFAKVHPQRDSYNFVIPDLMVKFAKENNMKVRGHTLVWHATLPDWLTDRKYSKEELTNILKNHIQTVVGHYKGKIYAWDVVNEAYNDDGTLRENIWLQTIGPEYIELAFRWAHEADPDALLFYNDYSNEEINKKSNAIFNMAKSLKEQGVPIDGVGFQMHSSITYKKNYEQIKENFKRYENIGLKTQITEMDVKIQHSNKPNQERLQDQAKMYSETLNACLASSSCNAFITWGVTDKYSWIPDYTGKEDAPLLFDTDYKPKPSYKAVYRALQKNLK
ncbi:endo-1,4-beta-xylanase [Priestia megaterium]|uniref:endo-1,4-beta-xylanase n=1 Tax=Priestia megaterium TaxID=1404 RepID=UPI0023DC7075|nr:endo-1,4-beta-xylanase [Priestia megaterium]MDF2013286.1 endo-1,4-beta-xylanase [Priestia megaterium]